MRFRMFPSGAAQQRLAEHCGHARFVWNLAVVQGSFWSVTRGSAPNAAVRSRQLTEARAEFDWLRAGSQMVQTQALNDYEQAMANFFGGSHGRPKHRRKFRNEGFRIAHVKADHVRKLNRRNAEVFIPKVGWVRFRLSRSIPMEQVKSLRVTLDRAGRWHVSFALIPEPIPAPGTGEIVGVDRGVVHAATCSDGTNYDYNRPDLDLRVRRLQRQMARQKKGSNCRARTRALLGRTTARRSDARKDFIEQTTTDLARRFDVIKIEKLNTKAMTSSAKGTIETPGTNVKAKAGLNRAILDKSWGLFATRLTHKAKDRVILVPAAYTSQRCSACLIVDGESRKNQADFRCTSCGYRVNADLNAALNIAAGHAVTACGDLGITRSKKREPQPERLAA